MVLPIGDAPNPRGVPVATYLLIAANVAVYLLVTVPLGATRPSPGDPLLAEYLQMVARSVGTRVPLEVLRQQVSAYDLFVYAHGFRPDAPSAVALVVSMFLHAGLLHLAGNMLFLWIYGDNVEQRLGAPAYLATYLVSGIAATLAHWAGALGSSMPVVGASGAISGVLGCYFVWFPRNVVRLLWFFPPFIGQVMEVPARLVLGLYVVADNVVPYLLSHRGDGGVAHGAHIGGFVAGVAIAWVVDRRARGAARVALPGGTTNDALGDLVDAGRYDDAATGYLTLPPGATRRALTPAQALALAGWLRREGQADGAAIVLRRLVRDGADDPTLARAHLALGLVLLEDLGQATAAYQHLLAALDLGADPATAAAARDALAAIAARQKRSLGWIPR